MGRKRLAPGDRVSIPVLTRLTEEEKRKSVECAAKEGLTLSRWLRMLVLAELRRHETSV